MAIQKLLIGSGVTTLDNGNVQNKYLDIAFDTPFTFETDKLYWVAIGAFSNSPWRTHPLGFQSLQMLKEQVNSNAPENPAFSRHLTYDSERFFNPPSGQNPANFTTTIGFTNKDNLRAVASGLWFRLYNPNSAVGLGNRGPQGEPGSFGEHHLIIILIEIIILQIL